MVTKAPCLLLYSKPKSYSCDFKKRRKGAGNTNLKKKRKGKENEPQVPTIILFFSPVDIEKGGLQIYKEKKKSKQTSGANNHFFSFHALNIAGHGHY